MFDHELLYFISRYYIIAIILGPCIFYIPKFFELRAETNRVSLDITVDCLPILQSTPFNLGPFKGGKATLFFIPIKTFDFEGPV